MVKLNKNIEKMEKFINEYFEKQKNTTHSPFLSERIIRAVRETEEKHSMLSKRALWQGMAVAASFAIVVVAGVALGNSYEIIQKEPMMLINDGYIKLLNFYQNFLR